MLFMQWFCIYYDKYHRSGNEIQRINAKKFLLLPEKVNLDGELFMSEGRYGNHIFPEADNRHFGRIVIRKQSENYQICYTRRPAQGFFKPAFMLGKNQYGRIIYNERITDYDGQWEYCRTIMNFIHADKSAFRTKLFFRKEPDYLFQDIAYLRYCGDYHKRRITCKEKLS